MESNLKVLIAKKNITIERLSKEINVSKVTLYRLANGKLKKPKYETLKKVSDFFSISVEELLKKETIWIQKNLSSIQLPTRLLKRFKDKYLTKILSYIIPQERT